MTRAKKNPPFFIGDPFPRMVDLVPEGQSNDVSVVHQEVTEFIHERSITQSIVHNDRDLIVDPGHYAQLFVGGHVMMSDVYMERRSNTLVHRKANGRVLIAGLGLGMIAHAIAAKPEVTSVTIIEKNADVIKLVAHTVPRKVIVERGDIFFWRPPKTERFDTIYFDIWRDITTENLDDMKILHRAFSSRLNRKNPASWMGSWKRDELKHKRERERKYDPYAGMTRCGTFR